MPRVKTTSKQNNNDTGREFAALLKERERDAGVSASLQEMYQAEGVAKNVARLRSRDANPLKRLAWTFFLFLTLVTVMSWAGFFLLHQGERLHSEDITLAVTGPAQSVAGQPEVYELQYKNVSAFDLHDVTIRLQLPDAVAFIDAAPAPVSLPTEGNEVVWQLETIPAKRSGRIALQAALIAKAGERARLQAALHYRPENFSASFSAQATFETMVSGIGVSAAFEAPSFTNVGQEMPITLRYARERDSYLQTFSVLVETGEQFKISGDNQTGVWEVKNLTDTQQELVIKGSYAKKPAAAESFTVKLAVPHEVNITRTENGATVTERKVVYRVFYEQELPIVVIDSALALTLSLNGATTAKPINGGDTLNYVVHYKNASEATLRNIIILATVDSPLVDWNALRDEHGGERKDNAILWTKAEVADLASLAPDAEGSFGFSLKIKDNTGKAPNAVVRAALDYSIDSAFTNTGAAPAIELVSPLNTDVTFNAQLRYFDTYNTAVGAGPLPPRVGETTTYRVYWSIEVGRHDLADVVVTTILPAGRLWANNYTNPIGDVSYDSATRAVAWRVPRVDATGAAVLDFAVSVTPTAAERNKIITVLNQSTFAATDAETNGRVTREAGPKTSALADDAAGNGKGQVE